MKKALYPVDPVLVVDDEVAWLRTLTLLLERALGITNVIQVQDSREALEVIGRLRVSLILLDVTMPYLTGDQVLEAVLREHPEVPVIINTGRNEVELAVRCMKLGAFDYFIKTVEQERLVAGIRRALALAELRAENLQLQRGLANGELKHPEAFIEMVGRAPALLAVCKYIEAVAVSREPVLIAGESGVGKELAARALWRLGAPAGPWQAVNVAGLDDNVFADTLFGHVRGAFTGAEQTRSGLIEQANGGMLFLDEIGDLSLPSQVKLLRLLQEGEYHPLGSDKAKKANVRIVVATNQDLEARADAGQFRRDLYYRLKAHHVCLPPLRQRREDLPLLLDHFLDEASAAFGRNKPTPPAEIFDLLGAYHFPGNVRELRAMVYDAVSQHQGGKLSLRAFRRVIGPPHAGGTMSAAALPPAADCAPLIRFAERLPTLRQAGELLVAEAMRRARGNQSLAARMLGITRPALAKRLHK
jgi:DNA-binding NtrC family response regulator